MFDIGQRVRCIKGGWGEYGMMLAPERCPNRPVRGSHYTIRTIERDTVVDMYCVRLVEIVNPPTRLVIDLSGRTTMMEPTFDSENFVPIEEQKTDISIFTEMLDSVPTLEDEVARVAKRLLERPKLAGMSRATLDLLDKAVDEAIRRGPEKPERGDPCPQCKQSTMYENFGNHKTCINCGFTE
jgi:hypothetical protein